MICSISGIRLPGSALTCLAPHVYVSSQLIQQWILFAGLVDFHNNPITEPTVVEAFGATGGNIRDKKLFFNRQFNDILYAIFRNDTAFDTSAIMYLKVLLGACLRYDATFLVMKMNELEATMSYIQLDNPTMEEYCLEIREILFTLYTSIVTDITAEAAISSLNMVGRMPSNVAVMTTIALIS
jgi:hypothetical protein